MNDSALNHKDNHTDFNLTFQTPSSKMSQLPLSENRRQFSRDEMNLAEFPLTALSTRIDPKVKTLEFKDTVRGKNGEVLNRHWIVTGADKFGLPTASDDEVLLGLLKLTVGDGFNDRKIYFTRYELLKILHWTTEGRSYSRLQSALDRLSGVRIKATNAFYDNESKSHITRNFGIIDAYEITDGRDSQPKPSFFIWSEVLFKSFQDGFIKKIDLDFFLSLKSAVTKRLYRYLDKHFWYKSKVQINLFLLAHEKIGISRNYKYASSIRQQIDPAIEELIQNGFLARCEYIGKGSETEIVLYAANGKPRVLGAAPQDTASANLGPLMMTGGAPPAAERSGEGEIPSRLLDALVMRGIREAQATRLLSNRKPETHERIAQIIDYYDKLVSSGSRLISRSPVGFLYRAVERPEQFVLPGEGGGRAVQEPLQFQSQSNGQQGKSGKYEGTRGGVDVKGSSLESEYLVERKQEIRKIRENVEPELLSKVRGEVESALQRLKGSVSENRFHEAIDHGVDEKLIKLFAFPGFEEWLKLRKSV